MRGSPDNRGRVCGRHLADHQPVVEHPDRRQALFDAGSGAALAKLLDVQKYGDIRTLCLSIWGLKSDGFWPSLTPQLTIGQTTFFSEATGINDAGHIVGYSATGSGTYEAVRLAIRISDMLNGREFKHKSLVLMARRERAMIGYGYCFIQLLEKMKNWETEVIQIGEEHEGALRLVTDVYAAA